MLQRIALYLVGVDNPFVGGLMRRYATYRAVILLAFVIATLHHHASVMIIRPSGMANILRNKLNEMYPIFQRKIDRIFFRRDSDLIKLRNGAKIQVVSPGEHLRGMKGYFIDTTLSKKEEQND